jgi:hypothetical protein
VSYPLDWSAVAAPAQLSTTLGNEVVILGLRDSVYYGLSEVGTRVWQLLQTPRPIGEIVDRLVVEYEVDRQQAEADLQALLRDLQARGLIVVGPPVRD